MSFFQGVFSILLAYQVSCVLGVQIQIQEDVPQSSVNEQQHLMRKERAGLEKSTDASDFSRDGSFRFWGYTARVAEQREQAYSLLQEGDFQLDPPSTEPQMLHEKGKPYYSQFQQELLLMPIFEKMGKGFFVESGAMDGEKDSNTLILELTKGWTGLLVEPNPEVYPNLHGKRRHAYTYFGCLSPYGREVMLHFQGENIEQTSHISSYGHFTVQAQPLQMLLERIGRTTVDFWSLDIEGSEANVLRSTDFSKIEVGVLLIEMNKGEENSRGVREVMDAAGFHKIGHSLDSVYNTPLDYIFVNPQYFQKRGLAVPTAEDLPAENRD